MMLAISIISLVLELFRHKYLCTYTPVNRICAVFIFVASIKLRFVITLSYDRGDGSRCCDNAGQCRRKRSARGGTATRGASENI